jgi:hypothetical protein
MLLHKFGRKHISSFPLRQEFFQKKIILENSLFPKKPSLILPQEYEVEDLTLFA